MQLKCINIQIILNENNIKFELIMFQLRKETSYIMQ